MPAPGTAIPRLRITPRSAALAVGMLGVTLAALRLVAASQRVIGWMVTAIVVAGLVQPAVTFLSKRVSRGASVLVVAVVLIGSVAGIGYSVAADVVAQTNRLQEVLPDGARRLERSGRFSELARDIQLSDRTQRFVDDLPERLRGGSTADALRSAATRGVAFLATGVLSIFFLLHGPDIAEGAVRQIRTRRDRSRLRRIVYRGFQRTMTYARGTIAMSAASGVVAYVLASAAGLPSPAPLALWVALWDVVPIVGVVVGGLPMLALAAATMSGVETAGLAAFFLAYQALETTVAQPYVEERSLRVGPFLTIGGGLVGAELYGIGGALLVPLAMTLGLAMLDEWRPAPRAHFGPAGH